MLVSRSSDSGHVYRAELRRPNRWGRRLAAALAVFALAPSIWLGLWFVARTPTVPTAATEQVRDATTAVERARDDFQHAALGKTQVSDAERELANWCLTHPDNACLTVAAERAAVEAAEAGLEAAEKTLVPEPFPFLWFVRSVMFAMALLVLLPVALVLWVFKRSFVVEIRQNRVQLGDLQLNASDIVGCSVERREIEVRLLGGSRHCTCALDASSETLDEIAGHIRTIGLSPDERHEEARSRLRVIRQHAHLTKRIHEDPV